MMYNWKDQTSHKQSFRHGSASELLMFFVYLCIGFFLLDFFKLNTNYNRTKNNKKRKAKTTIENNSKYTTINK